MSSYRELLAKFGAPQEVTRNPFYLLGLPINATARQIRRRHEDLNAAYDMGEGSWRAAFPYLLKGSAVPTHKEIEECFYRLDDIEFRIVASYYWFWIPPENKGDFQSAFDSFLQGDVRQAENRWQTLSFANNDVQCINTPEGLHILRAAPLRVPSSDDRRRRDAAVHNLGVLHRLKAMIWEDCNCSDGKNGGVDFEKIDREWRLTFDCERPSDSIIVFGGYRLFLPQKYWILFLSQLSGIEDPRLTDEFLSIINHVLDDLPTLWQSSYVIRSACIDDEIGLTRHTEIIRKNMRRFVLSEDVLDRLFSGVRERHASFIKKFDEIVLKDPAQGLEAANGLFDATSKDYDSIHALLGSGVEDDLKDANRRLRCIDPKDETFDAVLSTDLQKRRVGYLEMHLRFQEAIYDPVVKACLRYMIRYSEATKDWGITLQWNEFLRKLAVSERLRKEVEKDFAAIYRAQVHDLIEHYDCMVKSSPKAGLAAATQLLADSKQLRGELVSHYGLGEDVVNEINNWIAGSCRGYLIDFANATKQWEKCATVHRTIRGMVSDPKLKEALQKDASTLQENIANDRIRNRCWHCHDSNKKVRSKAVKMYGNVHTSWEWLDGSTERSWRVATLGIPLCHSCMWKYYMSFGALHLGGAILGALIGISVVDDKSESFACAFIWACICFGISLLFRKKIVGLWFDKFPDVQKAKQEGFLYGSKPSSF